MQYLHLSQCPASARFPPCAQLCASSSLSSIRQPCLSNPAHLTSRPVPRALATGYVSNLGSFFSLREWRVFRHESIRRASLVVDLPVSLYINGLGASFLSSRGKHCHPRRCRYAAHSWRRPAALWRYPPLHAFRGSSSPARASCRQL